MRALALLAVLVSASACDTLDDFSNTSGSYSATVLGDQSLDLSGWGYFSGLIQDEPPVSSIILTYTNSPTFRFQFPTASLQPGVYALPDDATATFEIDLASEPAYQATSGKIEVTSVADGIARGTFSFEASRSDGSITASGTFVAE